MMQVTKTKPSPTSSGK